MTMTAAVTNTEERLKINNATEFTPDEVLGLWKAIQRIRQSNARLSFKVDYWIERNEKELQRIYQGYTEARDAIFLKYVETKVIAGKTYMVQTGKDDDDFILSNAKLGDFKLVKVKEEEQLEFLKDEFRNPQNGDPCWIELKEYEGEMAEGQQKPEPTKHMSPYLLKYKSADGKATALDELKELDQLKHKVVMYKIHGKEMDGIQMNWLDMPDAKGRPVASSLEPFRRLLYDHAIIMD